MRSESGKEAGRRRQSTALICMLLAVMGMMSEEEGSEAGWVLERRSLCAGSIGGNVEKRSSDER